MTLLVYNLTGTNRVYLSQIDERVGVVSGAELFALVLNVVLDHEVWTQCRFVVLTNPSSSEALVPLRTAAVRDRSKLTTMHPNKPVDKRMYSDTF